MSHQSTLTGLIFSLVTYLLVVNHGEVAADGVFQLEVVRMSNPLSQLATGQCCEETPTTTNTTTTSDSSSHVCPGAPGGCRTAVHVCLKEFQDTPRPTGRCTFGEYKTDVLGPSSFGSQSEGSGTVVIPFNFTWSGLFTLVVKVVHRHKNGTEQLIVQDVKQSALNPDPEWHNISFGGSTTRGMYRIRIRCAPHYYNTTCTKLCKPRNDDFGHYTCDENGDKVCNPGWMGKPNCEKPICKTGCDKLNGYCERPGECRCRFGSGWEGPLCDKCQPAPGCVHGTCKTPYECTCELNWGGLLCNLDLNYCGRHKPCLNGGKCRSNQPNHYQCECVPGWTGRHCERRALSCSADPCLHGGTCQAHNNKDYTCLCPPGWTGNNCQQNVNECSSSPCRNGGTCIDGDDGFVCRCTARWQGPFCQLDADECQGRPCVNADACSNLVGDYVCTCQKGWTGKNCDININDCQDQCLHGSTCVDLVDGYHCACPIGYTGTRCEVDTDECASDPCLNGGQCQDLQGTYRCVCPPGYSGGNCQIDTDMCAPNPCQNGASCFDMQNGEFYCHCVDGFEGRNCQKRKDEDAEYISTVIDSCTVEDPTGVGRGGGPPRRVSSNVCGAHGECINENNHGAFSCRCHPGYTGKYCHLNINDCASQPCKNQGTCVDGINSLQCICRPGWEGPLCDINVDDCRNAPCRNGGVCVDLVNDFRCECEVGWKGRTCTLRSSSCEATTCANGGTCHDMGDTFSCVCRQGWKGRTCQTRESESCDSSPCQHGATCINSGDSFSCRCPDGYEGATCNININDCNPYPCYNGGKCIDGVNWYECNCTRGFTGPDCRININECESNPCTFGSTCIDGIGEYTCICPPGRKGKHCQTVTGDLLPKPQPCVYQNRVFAHQSTWEHDCNSCSCVNGLTSCSKVWCGPQNCLKHPNVTTDPMVTCGRDERCSVQTNVVCLTPPCLPWGRCRKRGRDLTSGTVIPGDVVPKTTCRPGMSHYGYTCVKMTLVFDLERVPIGVSVEAICRNIRGFQSLRPLASEHAVNVLCKLEENSDDTIEIAVSLSGFGVDAKGKGSESVHPTLRHVVDAIALSISRRRVNNTALSAVLEVKEEITIITETNTLVYMIPLVCSIMGFLGLLLILCLVVWHYRHLPSRHSDYRRPTYTSNEKTNNENEENLRRYRNSIYEKGGGSSHSSRNSSLKSPDTELLEFDLEKYEKYESPQRTETSKMTLERRNDAIQNISPLKTIKLKNINIELEREREGTV